MKLFNHLKTIIKHKHEVFKLCVKCGITWQGIIHDLSKFSLKEFIPSVKYFTGTHSPIESEIDDVGYSYAWLHHEHKNKHHPEYWHDTAHNIDCKIPVKYQVECFCDRIAAAKVYLKENYTDKAPLDYLDKNKTCNDDLNTELACLFNLLYLRGEDIACAYIKNSLIKK